jgi:hypothetical protein
MVLSHIIFGLDLALQTGAMPCVVRSKDGEYQGFTLVGGAMAVHKGSRFIPLSSDEELKQELLNLDTHSAALRDIANIINTYIESGSTEDGDEEYFDIRPSLITLPRQLHNIMRGIKFKPEDSKTILQCLKKLTFRQEYWNPKDTLHIERAINQMSKVDFPNSSWPIPYRTQVMFSSNRFQSILSAFGSQVPTLSLTSGTSVPLFKTRNKSTLTAKEGGKAILPEVPIFIRPLDESATAWKQVFDNQYLYVRYKRNREGIDGASKALKIESNDAQSLFSTLIAALPVKDTGKKRTLEDSEVSQEQRGRLDKRMRKDLEGNVASSTFLMSRLGIGSTNVPVPSQADSEVEDEEMEE